MPQVKIRWQLLICTVFLGLSATACRMAKTDEIQGRYEMHQPWGGASLVLNKDHSMVQVFHRKGSETIQNKGTWKFDNGYVMILPCLLISSDPQETRMIDGCGCSAEVSPLGIQINININEGLSYSKVASK